MKNSVVSCIGLVIAMCVSSCDENGPSRKDTVSAKAEAASGEVVVADTRLIQSDLKTLVVPQEDLGQDFPISAGEPKGQNEYGHVYFNPAALAGGGGGVHGLMGVIVSISRHDSRDDAAAKFKEQGGFDESSVMQDISKATPGAVPKSAQRVTEQFEGVDQTLAFRVHYILQDEPVYEFRYRLQIANTITNLIISAKGKAGQGEPDILETRAKDAAMKQVERLLKALE